MSKPKNKKFDVVWTASILREDVERLVPDDLTDEQAERMVHDIVYLHSLDKMQAGNPDSIQWFDEDGEPVHQLLGHLTESAMAGETEPVEYQTDLSWDEEAELMIENKENK